MENKNLPEIKFGTPVIDGHLDDVYLDSFCFSEEPMVHMGYSPLGREGAMKYMPNTSGKSYYLYDDKYLYICTVVHDETICSRGKEWRMNTVWPWNDDGAESYVWFSDDDYIAVHSDAHNIRSVVDAYVYGPGHHSKMIFRDTPREDWCATIDRENMNYTVEIRIPLPDYVGEGSVIGTILEIDDRWTVEGDDVENMVGALFVPEQCAIDQKFHVKLGKKSTK
ncbi:MAG: hypothetical protein E7672_09100 [Ruminococcaceae bacterium]|nr:hypothetical protein [Oscillospiraceae bacterium]